MGGCGVDGSVRCANRSGPYAFFVFFDSQNFGSGGKLLRFLAWLGFGRMNGIFNPVLELIDILSITDSAELFTMSFLE